MRGKKTDEYGDTALTQLEKQPPDILTHTQAPCTLEALDNVRIPYSYGCNVPSIGPPTGVSVLPFGGVSAFEEMLNLLGVPSANCPTNNSTPSAADVMHMDCESQKLNSTNAADVFQAYSALCSRGIVGHRSINVRQTTTVSSCNFIHDNGLRNTGPSTSHGGRNPRGNPDVSLPIGEATCSRVIGGRCSNFIHDNDVRNTGPSTSRAGRNTRRNTDVSLTTGEATCSRGIGSHRSNFIHYNDVHNNGPSTSRAGRNARGNPDVRLTTGEATCSKGIRGRLSVNVRQTTTVCSSNFIHDNDVRNTLRGGRNTRANPEVGLTTAQATCSSGVTRHRLVRHRPSTCGPTVGSSYASGAGTSYTYTNFRDSDQRCHYCGASFWTARDKCREIDIPEFKIRLYNGQGARGYEFPTSNTLGAMIFESGITSNKNFNVIIQHKDGPTQRVNKFHHSYMSLQFPLLFVYGQSGYHTDLKLKSTDGRGRARRITMLAYYRYQLHLRLQQYNLIFRGGILFQQYVVSVFCDVKQNRHDFLRKKQNDIRADYLSDLYDAISRGERDGYEVGGRIILPMSFMSGPSTIHVLYTVKFQKRGLPHCHTLLWVDSESKIKSAEDVDQYISAELPDPKIDPDGYNIVFETMMHGPCGAANMKASCMKGDNNYVEGRFICAHEAYWRIFKFEIHHREPVVQILAVHLEDTQRITFRDKDRLRSVVDLPGKKNTTLTEWFAYNASNEMGRHLSYLEFLSECMWRSGSKSWSPRRNNKSSIECLAYVHPTSGELFFLRMLLCHQKGCRDFFEACASATSEQLRFVFSHILLYCDVADPSKLWTKYWEHMSQDIPKKVSEKVQIPNYHLNADSLQGYTLYELEIILNNCGKSLQSFGRSSPPADLLEQLANRLLMEKRNYNQEELTQLKNDSFPRLNVNQKEIYDLIMNVDENSRYELIFVYGHGGTSKTFLWKTIISSLRSQGKIVLAVSSSGIAYLLLPSGRTAHSIFKLPLELTEEFLSPMNDRRCFEALNRSLRDIVNKLFSLFRGKSVLLGGDFRQTLPVKKGASKMEIIATCISESALWPSFKVFTLKQNMRLAKPDITLEELSLVNSFAWLLDIGDGKTGRLSEEDPENTSWIDIPASYCLTPDEQGLSKLIDFIYDQSTLHTPSTMTLQQKAIVCPKNETADIINSKVLDMVPGESTSYMSQDEATPTGNDGAETEMLYLVEHLNTLKLPGFPPHYLELKVGAPVMLLRNVNLDGGYVMAQR
ncbi:DNA helicase [Tanacetum coccineum]